MDKNVSRERKQPLGAVELIAIALGGMVGGGIFAILGISVESIGHATPVAILMGGLLALCSAYSYVKLARLYQDDGATYSFFKKTFPRSRFAAAAIGWLVSFGYISTLALYAYTFSSYFCVGFSIADTKWGHELVSGLVLLFFVVVNLVNVKGMGWLEDVMVYTKIVLLLVISVMLTMKGDLNQALPVIESETTWMGIVVIASITFVAYEGFQLVIHAYREMRSPERNVPLSIYSAIVVATLLYIVIAFGALTAIPHEELITDKEYALAAGSAEILGSLGYHTVVVAALLATSSAISGTLFGASRLMAVIADDGYLPQALRKRVRGYIPRNAIWLMFLLAFVLILSGGLTLILEFGSVTFIIVSFLMALANFKKRRETGSSMLISLAAMLFLFIAGVVILVFELFNEPLQLAVILAVYLLVMLGAYLQSKLRA